jgi:hypothetical protein
MAFSTSEAERLIPNNISDSGMTDDDSGLRLFRGMISPWDQIKSFKETYKFVIRHAAQFAVGWINALQIIEPDYEKRLDAMSSVWAEEMKAMWSESDELGIVAMFNERFEIPPFMEKSLYRAAIYADKGDSQMLMAGHIWYASNDRWEKDIHICDFDFVGPDVCDVSVGGGQYFCIGLAGIPLNAYDTERRGCGDAYCHVVQEARRKYGELTNKDGHDWEQWGPAISGGRTTGVPHKAEIEHLTTGVYTSPNGATWTTGEMFKDYCMWPLAYSTHAVGGMRVLVPEEDKAKAQHIINVMFDTAGKLMFAEWNTRKATRNWLGVPESVDDGRVLGGYISMILQARAIPWKFIEFTPDRTVIEVGRSEFEMFSQYPEFTPAYVAYFNGMAKTLVSAEWVVKLDETAPENVARFIIERGVYGFRRQKPGYTFDEKA